MTKDVRKKGELARNFLLTAMSEAGAPVASSLLCKSAAEKFGITENAVRKHLYNLRDQNSITIEKKGNSNFCSLRNISSNKIHIDLKQVKSLDEMTIYVKLIKPLLVNCCGNAEDVIEYCFTEMLNNVIDHSCGTEAVIQVDISPISTAIQIADDGIGIFKKIKNALDLPDERQSLLELSKGKFTTDPKNHSGEGIFWSSRACDKFAILSSELVFTHSSESPRDLLRRFPDLGKIKGTLVIMVVNNNTSRNMKQVFKGFSSRDEGFVRTEVPVKLLQYQNEGLVSRSQAKRLLVRVDRFKYVTFDFESIDSIGQAFADQIFRVFANAHPEVEISVKNANEDILDVIGMVKANRQE